jgi:small basic protein (TIGR04137 family)
LNEEASRERELPGLAPRSDTTAEPVNLACRCITMTRPELALQFVYREIILKGLAVSVASRDARCARQSGEASVIYVLPSAGSQGWSIEMSLDKSLKKGGGLARARNVLARAERLAVLQEDDRWQPSTGVFNLPKTKYRRLAPGQSGPKRPEPSK